MLLPIDYTTNGADERCIPYPRGKCRANLARQGLLGKVHLSSDMSIEDVQNEIRSVFKSTMGNDVAFLFKYLQASGGGSRSLTIPSVSASFRWTAQQVAKLGNQKNIIYIMAKKELDLNKDVSSSDDEEDVPLAKSRCQSKETIEKATNSNTIYSYSISAKEIQYDFPWRDINDFMRAQNLMKHLTELVEIDLTSDQMSDDDDGEPHDEISHPPVICSDPVQNKFSDFDTDPITIKHVLQQHQQRVVTLDDYENVERIHIRRTHLFEDSYRFFRKQSNNGSKMLKIIFLGEAAIDDGGPRREFFQLLLNDIAKRSGLFIGWPDHVVPLHNVEALGHNKFYVVGKMLAISIIQGGQPPVYFSSPVADFMVYDRVNSSVDIEDIPDFQVRQELYKVLKVNTTAQLQVLLSDDVWDIRFTCGYTKPTHLIEIKDKDDFVRSIWLHFVLFHPFAELEQLRKGFQETLQMQLLVCTHGKEIRALLAPSRLFDVSAQYLQDAFAVNYSPNGSNNRTKEESVMVMWLEYISNCNGERSVSLENILQFFSGASRLPAAGLDCTPKIYFTNEELLPFASTCALSITFSHSLGLVSYEDFENKMDMCILGSLGFGSV